MNPLKRFGLAAILLICGYAGMDESRTESRAESIPNRVFQNGEIKVTFPETGYAVKDKPATGTGYFAGYTTRIRFCRQPYQPPHVQQVRSEDGWLCTFYILPPLAEAEVRAEILRQKGKLESITYQKENGIGKETIKGHQVLVWRMQAGKTRLDHFLVLGPKHNYLFVSSPYGDGESTRKVVETLQVLK